MHIGIDLGGTKIEIIMLDQDYIELDRKRIPTPQTGYVAILDALYRLIEQFQQEWGKSTIGIGIPGAISPDTQRIKNANTTCLIGQKLGNDLQNKLDQAVFLANDADCFTLSEASDGAGAGAKSVFGVILGTGVGGGLVINNQLIGGPNAITGEWGHNPLPWPESDELPGHLCYCGKHGCIETWLSGPGWMKQIDATRFASPNKIAASSSALAQRYKQAYARRLAKGLASVINIVDPEVIVLGGGLSNMDFLYEQVPAIWGEYVFSDQVNTRLTRAKFGDSSGVRGAAWLGHTQALSCKE